MTNRFFLTASALALGFSPYVALAQSAPVATGPFAQASTLPFEAPDFAHIKDSDYQPAIEQGIAIERTEIEAIAGNPDAPTFANTIEAIKRGSCKLNC